MKTLIKKCSLPFVIIFIFIISFSQKASAQFFAGGDFNVTFLNGVNIDVAPIGGYKYKNFSAGISPVIQYTATSPLALGGQFSYGGRIFAEYSIWKGIFAHAEFQALNSGYLENSIGDIYKKGVWVMGAPIGVGYERELTGGLWLKVMVLYDALLDINIQPNSPQQNPSIRGGLTYVFNN